MPYTTTTKVRTEAWFEWNTNVTDDLIERYLIQSNGVVQSYVAAVYKVTDLAGSMFIGSQAEAMLQRAEELISAWFLLIKQYWLEGIWTEADGYKKKAEGEKLLMSLSDPKKPLLLLDTNWSEFTRQSVAIGWKIAATGIVVGWNKFRVNDVY